MINKIREYQYLLEKSKAKQIGREPTDDEISYDKSLERKIAKIIYQEAAL